MNLIRENDETGLAPVGVRKTIPSGEFAERTLCREPKDSMSLVWPNTWFSAATIDNPVSFVRLTVSAICEICEIASLRFDCRVYAYVLMTNYRYIELNSVRAGMVSDVVDYCWSSYGCNGQDRSEPLIRSHPAYELIAKGEGGRHAHYRDLVFEGISDDDLASIRLYVQRQRALGSSRFQHAIETMLGRWVGLGMPGRPATRSIALITAGEVSPENVL